MSSKDKEQRPVIPRKPSPQPNVQKSEEVGLRLLKAYREGGDEEFDRIFDQLYPQKPLDRESPQS